MSRAVALRRQAASVASPLWRFLPEPVRLAIRPTARRLFRDGGAGGLGGASRSLSGAHPLVPVGPAASTIPLWSKAAERPAISIVVPVHDDSPFVECCLASIALQDHSDWECVVVDDASSDATLDVVLAVAERDRRFRVVRHDGNRGLAATRNTGIAASTGEYLTFLDGDDFLFPGSLRVRLREAQRSGDPRVIGSWCDWSSVGEPTGLDFSPGGPGSFGTIDYETGGGENQLISTSPLLRRDVVVSLGGFDDGFRTAEDFEFWTRLFRNGFRLRFAPVVGVAYRQKRASMISGNPAAHARNAMAVYDYMARPLGDEDVSPLATRPYVESPEGIPSDRRRIERLVSFLTYAVLTGDDQEVSSVLELLPPGLLGSGSFLIDADGQIDASLRRHGNRIGGLGRVDADRIRSRVLDLLADRSRSSARAAELVDRRPVSGALRPDRVSRLHDRDERGRRLRARGHRDFPDLGHPKVVLRPSTLRGADDLLLIGRELVERGVDVALHPPGPHATLRRRAHFEGIRVVVTPHWRPDVLIGSHVDALGGPAGARVLVSSEPRLRAPVHATAPDVAFTRFDGEAELFGLRHARVVGWPSRVDAALGAAGPRDGQSLRSRVRTILALEGVDESRASADDLLREVSGPLLPTHSSAKVVGVEYASALLGVVTAVLGLDDVVAVDALAVGTPQLVANSDGWAARAPGVSAGATLDDVGPDVPDLASEWVADPLAVIVAELEALLEPGA